MNFSNKNNLFSASWFLIKSFAEIFISMFKSIISSIFPKNDNMDNLNPLLQKYSDKWFMLHPEKEITEIDLRKVAPQYIGNHKYLLTLENENDNKIIVEIYDEDEKLFENDLKALQASKTQNVVSTSSEPVVTAGTKSGLESHAQPSTDEAKPLSIVDAFSKASSRQSFTSRVDNKSPGTTLAFRG